MTVKLRKATMEELNDAFQCIIDAREYQNSLGFVQWTDEYPTHETIKDDIASGTGFAFSEDDRLIGYCCVLIGDEPAYHEIDGAWRTDHPYAVVHRMAFLKESRGKGYAGKAFSLVKEYCLKNGIEAIRVDTQEENKVMQHVLEKEGFTYCGTIMFAGGPKLAYEWDA